MKDKILAWAATSRWVLYLVLAGVVLAVMFAITRMFHSPGDTGKLPTGLPDIPEPLLKALEKAHEDSLVRRISATTKAEDQKQVLVETMKIDDGVERRKKLAALLGDS